MCYNQEANNCVTIGSMKASYVAASITNNTNPVTLCTQVKLINHYPPCSCPHQLSPTRFNVVVIYYFHK